MMSSLFDLSLIFDEKYCRLCLFIDFVCIQNLCLINPTEEICIFWVILVDSFQWIFHLSVQVHTKKGNISDPMACLECNKILIDHTYPLESTNTKEIPSIVLYPDIEQFSLSLSLYVKPRNLHN